MKILINLVSAKISGVATYAENLIKELIKRNNEFEYIICASKKFTTGLANVPQNLRIISTEIGSSNYLKRFVWDQIVLRYLIRKHKIDVLFSSANFALLFSKVRQILLIRMPLYYSQLYLRHVYPKKPFKTKIEFGLRRFLTNLSAKQSDIVMFPTLSMRNDFEKFVDVDGKKLVTNHYGTYIERFSTARNKNSYKQFSNSRKIKLLYMTMYGDHKNLTTLLKAMLLLKKKGHGNIVLETPVNPYQEDASKYVTYDDDLELANSSSLKDNLKFLKKVPYGEITKYYENTDIFIWPSIAESFGHSLVEAMASGLPIVASDIPINREICKDAALYFGPFDEADLANKIIILINDANLRTKLCENTHTNIRRFSWQAHVDRLLESFRSLCRN